MRSSSGIGAVCAFVALGAESARSAEGPTVAGPIGGTDIRSAQLPPPGLYGGFVALGSPAFDFVDGNGDTVPGLEQARLTKYLAGPFFLYVPDATVMGGNIGLAGFFPFGKTCGRLFALEPKDCDSGMGDPYVELSWSRSFGNWRQPSRPGALPIHEGLSVALGIGAILPLGSFDSSTPTNQARSPGTNIVDIAPSIAITYTTPPLIADGTEFSAKLFWNEYFENEETGYLSGALVNLDFALTERIGRWQVGLAGNYAVQVEDDRVFGVPVPPDGNRARSLALGGVVAVDIPETGSAIKFKVQRTVEAENAVKFWGASLSAVRRF